jgi:uncharacterized protein
MLSVTDNPAGHRYEGRVGPDLAGVVDYHLQPGLITILHTEVADDFAGKGVGSLLVAATLDDVRARGLRVFPICPFVRAYIQRHPEYADLVGLA